MERKFTNNLDTISEPIETGYPKLIVEDGKAYSFDSVRGKLEILTEFCIGVERNRENPVTIGRETAEIIEIKDIFLDKKYQSVSRNHAEIYFSQDQNSYFLVDYSLNGTLINAQHFGGNRVRETRKLEHEDLIEIPSVGEKVRIRFLMYERTGISSWIKGRTQPIRKPKRIS